MFKKLLPRNENFFAFFEMHAALIVKAAQCLPSFACPIQPEAQKETFERIKMYELEGDKITHRCVEALHKTFITPIERTEIHRLMSALDDILDEIEDSGKLIVLYKLECLSKEALQMVNLIIQSAQEVEAAVKELRKMKNTEQMKKYFYNINNLENEADTLLVYSISRLFEEESDVKTIIKWKEVYEHLERATDICEDVANILEGILLENE